MDQEQSKFHPAAPPGEQENLPHDGTKISSSFSPRCLSIDLEVGKNTGRINRFAAVRGDTGETINFEHGSLSQALARLDELALGATFLLGHNLIAFDLPHLIAADPELHLLKLPVVDTLRLNPLAFPRNPYHRLVKHYQDGQLQRGRLNDPELDARLTIEVFRDQWEAFLALRKSEPELLQVWHWLTTAADFPTGFNAFFTTLRQTPCPADSEAQAVMAEYLADKACLPASRTTLAEAGNTAWPLAYALAWLSVAGGNSVSPPWVRHQFPETGTLIKGLRDTPCNEPACNWCRERHDARKELTRWFGFPSFRPEPKNAEGYPLQQAIVEAAMQGNHLLGILPTGTGKSLCYQIPALSRYDKTGALTIVISPLVALMSDQVAGLEARGITSCAALNGLLSMPERVEVLDRVRLGDVAILIVSPEQLRNRAFRKIFDQREIGAWVLDEAHCLSKWGQDFRPDYRYVGRFIKEKALDRPIPPVLCLTATAKPDVVRDILAHFRDKVGIELALYDGGANRTNLDFAVVPTTPGEKLAHIHQLLLTDLPSEALGGAIVYCATRRQSEDVASFLREKGTAAEHFHAGLPPESKKNVQERFIRGDLQVICATNAFGMGIDKPDVRLVIHADIPGSLENYLQEAGRAGRDRQQARCILLYSQEDVEKQFSMSARSRLNRQEIQAILRSLWRLDSKKRQAREVVATAGEILAEEEEGVFERDSATDDTRVRTAVAWLEESLLLSREENQVQIFPSSLRVGSVAEAAQKLANKPLNDEYRKKLLALVEVLVEADPDEGVTTDELMGISGLSSEGVRHALHDLERLGLATNDTILTAFVHSGVARSSKNRLGEAVALELALIEEMQLVAPDMGKGDSSVLYLRHATQRLKDAGHQSALPEKVWRLLRGLATDGRHEGGGVGSLRLHRLDMEAIQVTLQREWSDLHKTARLRQQAATLLLYHLLSCLPQGSRGTDLLAETTLGKLLASLTGNIVIRSEAKDPPRLLDRALLWLHEQEVIRLNKGMAVFRPAMTIRLEPGRRGFANADFTPLKLHYDEKVFQIHVMVEYAQQGLKAMLEALRLAMDYFSLQREEFLKRWLPDREQELSRQTTPESWHAIVEQLHNPVQQRIVADNREQTNVLVLAGPGSGKTRVLVHRIAYLVRVRRENPRGIIALAYNRHAAVEIRRRLADLIGNDAKGVTVLTCHALAMRLIGASFAGRSNNIDNGIFKEILEQATALLKGEGLPQEEAGEQRDRLLAGFRWILVDEYQDIGPEQYELISALAGRTLHDVDRRLSLFAVGDDDQNIYAFDGASVEFIRRYTDDYDAKPVYLTENYRSTSHIITTANLLIQSASRRMKSEHPITINRARRDSPPGGRWEELDPVCQGRVQVLPAGRDAVNQAVAVMTELQRLSALDQEWDWAKTAVIASEWKYLDPVRCFAELNDIPVQMANEDTYSLWRLRETQAMLEWLRNRATKLVTTKELRDWLAEKGSGPWWQLLREAVDEHELETLGSELPADHFREWLAEWGREIRRRQQGLLLLTAHRAKGLEFAHVAVLDGGWGRVGSNEDQDAPRRLFYVAMTRAEKFLVLARFDSGHKLLDSLPASFSLMSRPPTVLPPTGPELRRQYRRLTLQEVDIGFAGSHSAQNQVHAAIADLSPGDLLQVKQGKDCWQLFDQHGRLVGHLARAFNPPSTMRLISARVAAILVRERKDSKPEFLGRLKCDRWELVMPELVYEEL